MVTLKLITNQEERTEQNRTEQNRTALAVEFGNK
jgi:hypothetical protein